MMTFRLVAFPCCAFVMSAIANPADAARKHKRVMKHAPLAASRAPAAYQHNPARMIEVRPGHWISSWAATLTRATAASEHVTAAKAPTSQIGFGRQPSVWAARRISFSGAASREMGRGPFTGIWSSMGTHATPGRSDTPGALRVGTMKEQLLAIAARCEAISRRSTDLTTAQELRDLAADLRRSASQPVQVDDDPPPHVNGDEDPAGWRALRFFGASPRVLALTHVQGPVFSAASSGKGPQAFSASRAYRGMGMDAGFVRRGW
jgi:hypothetical protein